MLLVARHDAGGGISKPIEGEAFLQSFQQRRGRLGIVVLQPLSDLAKLGMPSYWFIFHKRAHERGGLGLRLAGSRRARAQLVVPAPLYRHLGSETHLIAVRSAFEPSNDE